MSSSFIIGSFRFINKIIKDGNIKKNSNINEFMNFITVYSQFLTQWNFSNNLLKRYFVLNLHI